MVKMFVRKILAGGMTIDKVPKTWKSDTEQVLDWINKVKKREIDIQEVPLEWKEFVTEMVGSISEVGNG